jgi:hypothetical protein
MMTSNAEYNASGVFPAEAIIDITSVINRNQHRAGVIRRSRSTWFAVGIETVNH